MKNYFKIRALLSKITKKEELTTKEMNFLKGITDFNAQYMMINKEPEILPYVLNDWSVNCGVENIEKLTKTAVRLKIARTFIMKIQAF